jgi:hypothetical protein
MLYDNKTMNQNKNSRTIKDDFFVNLEKTLTKYAQSEYIIPFKCAKQLVIGVGGNRTCSKELWHMVENFLMRSLEHEIDQAILKTKQKNPCVITKNEFLALT